MSVLLHRTRGNWILFNLLLLLFFLFLIRCADESVRPVAGSVQYWIGGRSHRHQDLRCYHEFPGERLRNLSKGQHHAQLSKYSLNQSGQWKKWILSDDCIADLSAKESSLWSKYFVCWFSHDKGNQLNGFLLFKCKYWHLIAPRSFGNFVSLVEMEIWNFNVQVIQIQCKFTLFVWCKYWHLIAPRSFVMWKLKSETWNAQRFKFTQLALETDFDM